MKASLTSTHIITDLEECKFVSRPDSRTEIALQVLDTQDVKYVSAFGDRGKDKKMSYCILSRNQEFGIDFRGKTNFVSVKEVKNMIVTIINIVI